MPDIYGHPLIDIDLIAGTSYYTAAQIAQDWKVETAQIEVLSRAFGQGVFRKPDDTSFLLTSGGGLSVHIAAGLALYIHTTNGPGVLKSTSTIVVPDLPANETTNLFIKQKTAIKDGQIAVQLVDEATTTYNGGVWLGSVTTDSDSVTAITMNPDRFINLGSGHTIKNPAGTALTQRAVLKFTGSPVTVSDVGGETVVNVDASSSGNVRTVSQTAHGLAVGNLIKSTGANTYAKAQADSVANAEVVGFVSAVGSANSFTYSLPNSIVPISGGTAGTGYLLSDTTAGAYTTTEPSDGSIRKLVLLAISSTEAIFVNYTGFVVNGLEQITIDDDYTASGAEERIDADASDNPIVVTLPTPSAGFYKNPPISIANIGNGDNVTIEGDFTNDRTTITPIEPNSSLQAYVVKLKDGATYKWHAG